MNLFRRILLVIYTFFITIISAALLIIPFSRRASSLFVELLDINIYSSFSSRILFFLVIALFFVVSIYFLYGGIKKSKQDLSVVKGTDLGELSISLAAIESLTLTSLKNIKGIKELKADTARTSEGVEIILRLVVFPEVIITELTKKVQSSVKADVEAATGIKVTKVTVKIENVTNYTMRSVSE